MSTATTSAEHDRQWWRAMLPYARPYRGGISLLGLTVLLLAASAVALPWPTKIAIDNVLLGQPLPGWMQWLEHIPGAGSPTGQLIILGAMSVGLYVVRAALSASQQVSQRTISQQMSFDLAGDLLAAEQQRSLASQSQRPTGDTIQRITMDSRAPSMLVLIVGLGLFGAFANLTLMVIVTTNIDWQLTLIAFGGALPLLVLVVRAMRPMRANALAQANAEGVVSATMERTLRALPEVQSFVAEPIEQARFDGVVDERLHAVMRSQTAFTRYQLAIGAFMATGTALVYLVGGLSALDGGVTVGDLVVVTTYVAALFGPIAQVTALGQAQAFARASALRVSEVLDGGESIPEAPHPVAPPEAPGGSRIVFEGVTFGYVPDRPVLHEIDLVVEPGQMVALVGSTGAGKSTLVSLVPRFFDPQYGRVIIDGVDVRDVAVRSARERVSVVRQEAILLPVTVAENIAYGRPHATREEIEAAARAANAAEFIERLPQGYDTRLGQWGATLSGGQQQRLSIARALLKDAPILILDEPTSALDAESEALVVSAIERLANSRTVLVIAHRLSTVRRADRIVVLEAGRVAEVGSHDALVAAGGTYATFHQMQFRADRAPVGEHP